MYKKIKKFLEIGMVKYGSDLIKTQTNNKSKRTVEYRRRVL
jgi:hypothetical protein